MAGVADGSVDLVLCNPPFHRGNSRDSAVAFEMLADAARALRLGGELWTVYNSHLPYLRTLRRLVGSTSVVGQNTGFTVTRSVRSP
jgi:16S rRNA (guanine1207-N2)-methyltransferase